MASVLAYSPSHFDFGSYHSVPSFRRSHSSLASVRSDSTVFACRHRHVSIRSVSPKNTASAQLPFAGEDHEQVQSLSAFDTDRDASSSRLSSFSASSGSASLTFPDDPVTPTKTRDEINGKITQHCHLFEQEQEHNEKERPLSDKHSYAGKDHPWDDALMHPYHTLDINAGNQPHTCLTDDQYAEPPTFRRWVSTLRRRNLALQDVNQPHTSHMVVDDCNSAVEDGAVTDMLINRRRACSHSSSTAFVTGVRSASLTTNSVSVPSHNTCLSVRSPRDVAYVASDVMSRNAPRRSTDSDSVILAPILDEAALKRSQKRARKILELVHTEEGYLSDLKCLQNAYFTILLPHASGLPRIAAAQACVSDLLQLHETILDQLQVAARLLLPGRPVRKGSPMPTTGSRLCAPGIRHVPCSPEQSTPETRRGYPPCITRTKTDSDTTELHCPTQVAADIARIFLSKSKHLAVYEEYVVRCDLMQLDVDLQRTDVCATDHDRALEALHASVCPVKDKSRDRKKALGLKDLLIKPVQRITRYELLLRDLCTLTPSCDDPSSHSILDDALGVISNTCHNLNEASGSPERLRMMDIQRCLQQRLHFDSHKPTDVAPVKFGRLLLCGALFIAYRGTTSIKGQYAICILYESCLVVAAPKGADKYHAVLTVLLAHATIEEADNGKALQCHTTPHTWKIVFESNGAMFEAMCVACSETEAKSWRQHLHSRIIAETEQVSDGRAALLDIESPLTIEMRSVGKAYGRSLRFHRRASVQRAATLGPLTELNQVMIKNTQATGKDTTGSSNSLPMGRSQSLMSPSHVTVLAPRRSERIHLEALLVDVWTKDALPFPGLGPKRGEYSMRASAGHVMRKLSIASITSNFSKRSTSFSQCAADEKRTKLKIRPASAPKQPKKPADRAVINFQTAPEAFLPEDFTLQGPAKARGRLAGLRTFTMGAEKTRTALTDGELKRSSSVLMRRRRSDFDAPPGRSQTSMSTPAVLALDDGAPETLEGDVRHSMRQRAKSRLVRLLS